MCLTGIGLARVFLRLLRTAAANVGYWHLAGH
jgi:hypothetical protein